MEKTEIDYKIIYAKSATRTGIYNSKKILKKMLNIESLEKELSKLFTYNSDIIEFIFKGGLYKIKIVKDINNHKIRFSFYIEKYDKEEGLYKIINEFVFIFSDNEEFENMYQTIIKEINNYIEN